MTTAAKQPLYEVGVEDFFIAMMVGGKDDGQIPTYDEIEHYPVIETLGIQGNQTTATKWASNKLFVNVVKNSTYTLTLDHPALPTEIKDKIIERVEITVTHKTRGSCKSISKFIAYNRHSWEIIFVFVGILSIIGITEN